MPRYNYVALDARGQEASGLVEAASSNEAIGQLRQAGYFPTSVFEEAKSGPDGKVFRRAFPASADLQRSLRQHGESGRARRRPRGCAEPACGISGESRENQKQS